jgi:hypothetical protein
MINYKIEAIYKLYPQVTKTIDDIAYDAEDNIVEYDLAAVTAQAQADEAAKQSAKDSATSKLKALGLTDDEISALKGTL